MSESLWDMDNMSNLMSKFKIYETNFCSYLQLICAKQTWSPVRRPSCVAAASTRVTKAPLTAPLSCLASVMSNGGQRLLPCRRYSVTCRAWEFAEHASRSSNSWPSKPWTVTLVTTHKGRCNVLDDTFRIYVYEKLCNGSKYTYLAARVKNVIIYLNMSLFILEMNNNNRYGMVWYSRVWRPHRHIIGHFGDDEQQQ